MVPLCRNELNNTKFTCEKLNQIRLIQIEPNKVRLTNL